MGSDARDPVKHMLCDLDGTLYRSDALNKGVEKHIAGERDHRLGGNARQQQQLPRESADDDF